MTKQQLADALVDLAAQVREMPDNTELYAQMQRGVNRKPNPNGFWEAEPSDRFTLIVKINGGASHQDLQPDWTLPLQ